MLRSSSIRARSLIVASACLLLILGACGGSSDDNTNESGKTFTFAAVDAPSTLDVWTHYEGETSRVNAFEWGSNLVEYAPAKNACETMQKSSDLTGNLAESWKYNDDKSQLLVTLRDGVKSAAGNVLTAEDVVWSFDRARKQSTIVTFLLTSVAQFNKDKPVEAVDDKTVAFNVETPTALDVAILTWPQFAVLDSTEVKKHVTSSDEIAAEWLKTNSPNFGPWQIDSFKPGSEIVYTENPNFWNAKERGNVDKLIVRAVPDAATRLQLLESGSVDYAEKLAFDQYTKVEKSSAVELLNCASPNRDTLQLNEKFGAFANPDVRKAISMAIDRDALVEGVYDGLAKPAKTGVSDVYWKPGADAKKFTYDPDAAKQLLADAGVSDLKFGIMASPSRPGAHAESLAIQIQSMLKKVGVTASIRMVPGGTEFSDDFFASKFDAVIYTEPPAVADPFYSLNLYNSSESFQNTFSYHNDEYDALTKKVQVTDVGADRDALIAQVSDLMVETMPQVYLTDNRYLYAFGKSVKDFNPNPAGSLLIYHLNKGD